ncbi:uncharacterized protein BJ212DRAFT_1399370, partial [Suillus subaureus]
MSPSSSTGLHYSFVPSVILIDHGLSTISPSAWATDSWSRACCLILRSPSSSFVLHCSFTPGHLARSLSFNNPAPTLQERFRLQGAPSDLDGCIEFNRAALLLRPPSHSDRPPISPSALETDSGSGVSRL